MAFETGSSKSKTVRETTVRYQWTNYNIDIKLDEDETKMANNKRSTKSIKSKEDAGRRRRRQNENRDFWEGPFFETKIKTIT